MFGVVGAVFVDHIRVIQASKTKPDVGVECRSEVKSTDFDQIDEIRFLVTDIIQQNASISDSD